MDERKERINEQTDRIIERAKTEYGMSDLEIKLAAVLSNEFSKVLQTPIAVTISEAVPKSRRHAVMFVALDILRDTMADTHKLWLERGGK